MANHIIITNKKSGGGAVESVNTKTGAVVLNKSDIGLPNVDNTSDLAKPISTATQSALDLKFDIANVLDEDDFSSDSATKVPTQQSTKAYVDANGGGFWDVVKKQLSDQSVTNSTTLLKSTDLVASLESNSVYVIKYEIFGGGNGTSNEDVNVKYTGSQFEGQFVIDTYPEIIGAARRNTIRRNWEWSHYTVDCILHTNSAGDIEFSFANSSAAGNTSYLKEGSLMFIKKVG